MNSINRYYDLRSRYLRLLRSAEELTAKIRELEFKNEQLESMYNSWKYRAIQFEQANLELSRELEQWKEHESRTIAND